MDDMPPSVWYHTGILLPQTFILGESSLVGLQEASEHSGILCKMCACVHTFAES
jgi:hypothetical protein